MKNNEFVKVDEIIFENCLQRKRRSMWPGHLDRLFRIL